MDISDKEVFLEVAINHLKVAMTSEWPNTNTTILGLNNNHFVLKPNLLMDLVRKQEVILQPRSQRPESLNRSRITNRFSRRAFAERTGPFPSNDSDPYANTSSNQSGNYLNLVMKFIRLNNIIYLLCAAYSFYQVKKI